MVAPERRGQLAAGRLQREVGALVEGGPESLGTELFGQVAHAGQAAVLAVPQLPEELRDATTELDGLIGLNEDVDVGGHALAVGETTTDEHVEANGAVRMLRRPQTDVVDFDAGAVLGAARDGDLELSRQVGVLAVTGEEGRDGLGHGKRRDDLLLVDAGDGARAHVARRVATRLDRGQADVPEALPDAGDVGDADPVELNVLPRREVGIAVPEDGAVIGTLGERVGRHADLPDLGRGHHSARDLDAHHEGVAPLALGIHANPLEPLHLSGHRIDGARTLLAVGIDHRLCHLEGVPGQLQLLGRVELADVPVGPDELEPAITPAAELHPIGIVEVARH